MAVWRWRIQMDGATLLMGDITCKGRASVDSFGRQEGPQTKIGGELGQCLLLVDPIVLYSDWDFLICFTFCFDQTLKMYCSAQML